MFFFDKTFEDRTFKARSVEHAYLAVLNDDLITAKTVFETVDSPRGHWGVSFIEMLEGYIEQFPTYFGIRNFYEIDLDFLIKNEKYDYTERILSAVKFLTNINQEIYKYTARVMYENKLYNASLEYMEKSKELFYKDPELHFMLAKYYINTNQFIPANFYIDECLKILPSYNPALKMKAEISGKL